MAFLNRIAPLVLALVLAGVLSVIAIEPWRVQVVPMLLAVDLGSVAGWVWAAIKVVLYWPLVLVTVFLLGLSCFNTVYDWGDDAEKFRIFRWFNAAIAALGISYVLMIVFGGERGMMTLSLVSAPPLRDVGAMLVCVLCSGLTAILTTFTRMRPADCPRRSVVCPGMCA